ncbi:hypothetical protein [Marinicella meishanensis]|uniref:hypothetical protein n=1 Tax=Marinicella meishanensis TaxID=2873263 RepID=UPI001CBE649A|nr:hypothetical protein [Marinicella sp. NBU2979]
MIAPFKKTPKKPYTWRRFRRALLGLIIGLGVSALILWLINGVFELGMPWGLVLSAAYVFVIGPFFIQWIMDQCRHPDDKDGSNLPRLAKFYLFRK